MLEVKKDDSYKKHQEANSSEKDPESKTISEIRKALDEHDIPRAFEKTMEAAKDPKMLRQVITNLNEMQEREHRLSRYTRMDRDEGGKKFVSIEVLPHFL